MNNLKEFIGEYIGTFIIVFFGCGSIASAILFNTFNGSTFELAIVWFIGVSLAIYAANNFSGAHLNPAVSIAMVVAKKFSFKKLPLYIMAQFLGAFSSAAFLYFIYSGFISDYEIMHQMIRGSKESIVTASIFGEYFPNPGFASKITNITPFQAFVSEAVGTLILVFMILWLTAENNVSKFTPLIIGLTVAALIALLAPISQGGFNPARDFGPRLFSYFAGWGNIVFQKPSFSFATVYILGPIIGGILAALIFNLQEKIK